MTLASTCPWSDSTETIWPSSAPIALAVSGVISIPVPQVVLSIGSGISCSQGRLALRPSKKCSEG